MTPEERAGLEWYGNLILTDVLPCPVCGAAVANMSSSALKHKQWHESRGEVAPV
jgi:hypothetical protein